MHVYITDLKYWFVIAVGILLVFCKYHTRLWSNEEGHRVCLMGKAIVLERSLGLGIPVDFSDITCATNQNILL